MVQDWLALNLLPIIFVIFAAFIADRFGGALVAAIIRRTVTTHYSQDDRPQQDIKKRQDTLVGIAVAIVRIVVWLTATYSVAFRFGVDPTPILAGASVIGLALSFGAQSLVKDFVSGIYIILENQYRVGDTVSLDGANGVVERITIRTTIVRDKEGSVHYIPNGTISHAVNKTMGYGKINMVIAVKPKTDVDKLAEVINDVGAKLFEDEKWSKKLLQAPRFVNITNFTATTLEVKISGKTKAASQGGVTGELRKRLLIAFDAQGIELSGAPTAAPAKKK